MGQIVVSINPPEYWEEFELLTLDMCKIIWEDNNAQRHGRSGQNQFGVDIYGYDYNHKNFLIGVQCKKRSPVDPTGKILAGGLFTEREIVVEIEKATNFQPKLDEFILATTALRDVNVQRM